MNKIDIPWSPELVEKIYKEKVSWIENAKISPEEKELELEKLREWRESTLKK